MNTYDPARIDLKTYPHFDKELSRKKIHQLVTDPKKVQQNPFYPFLEYKKQYKAFDGTIKSRTIRYASRRDAYIFAYYRNLLLEKYENKLIEYNIQDFPIAYRKIFISPKSEFGKCNIHFANDAFKEIKRRAACFAIALDIKSFFDSLNHIKLQKKWCKLLQVEKLPPDHAAVFKAITQYRFVDRNTCYERLGYMGDVVINKITKKGFLIARKDLPIQLCAPKIFREKICGNKSEFSDLIQKNKYDFGIPQGSPISDLLANTI